MNLSDCPKVVVAGTNLSSFSHREDGLRGSFRTFASPEDR